MDSLFDEDFTPDDELLADICSSIFAGRCCPEALDENLVNTLKYCSNNNLAKVKFYNDGKGCEYSATAKGRQLSKEIYSKHLVSLRYLSTNVFLSKYSRAYLFLYCEYNKHTTGLDEKIYDWDATDILNVFETRKKAHQYLMSLYISYPPRLGYTYLFKGQGMQEPIIYTDKLFQISLDPNNKDLYVFFGHKKDGQLRVYSFYSRRENIYADIKLIYDIVDYNFKCDSDIDFALWNVTTGAILTSTKSFVFDNAYIIEYNKRMPAAYMTESYSRMAISGFYKETNMLGE